MAQKTCQQASFAPWFNTTVASPRRGKPEAGSESFTNPREDLSHRWTGCPYHCPVPIRPPPCLLCGTGLVTPDHSACELERNKFPNSAAAEYHLLLKTPDQSYFKP